MWVFNIYVCRFGCIGLEASYLFPLTVSYGIGIEDLKVYFYSSIVPSMDYLVLSKKAYVLILNVDKFKYLGG